MAYYHVLELVQECTQVDITQSYRRLVRQHHPDKGGDPTAFRRVHEAYTVLRDPERRQLYDLQEKSVLDLFGDTSCSPHVFEKKDSYHRVVVSLEDICCGRDVPVRVKRRVVRRSSLEECEHCLGTGIDHLVQNVGHISNVRHLECLHCESGYVKATIVFDAHETSNLVVCLPLGCPDGMMFRFLGQGDELPGHPVSDLVITIQYGQSDDYDVGTNSLDVSRVLRITLLESLLGFTHSWTHPDGSTMRCSMGTMCPPGMYVIPHAGIHYEKESMYGHLYVQVEVTFPAMIDLECVPNDLTTMFHQQPTFHPMSGDVMLYDRVYTSTNTVNLIQRHNEHV
jgi:DnaJ-class molecular chaperone